MSIIGDRIRAARVAAGLTQKQLGERAGIAEPTIRRYELGKLNPKSSTVEKIANALEIPTSNLYPDGFWGGNYEPANEEEAKLYYELLNDTQKKIAENTKTVLNKLGKFREEWTASLVNRYERQLENVNEYGIQAVVLAVLTIMADDVNPAEIITNMMMSNVEKMSQVTDAIEHIAKIPAYQRQQYIKPTITNNDSSPK